MAEKSVVVIGSGFAGLSAASFMAKEGWKVTVIEKNKTAGGRARQLKENYMHQAFLHLDEIAVLSARKEPLIQVAKYLVQRDK